jgi:hypothetical protein
MSTPSRAPKQTNGKRRHQTAKGPGVEPCEHHPGQAHSRDDAKPWASRSKHRSSCPATGANGRRNARRRISMTICDCWLTDTANRRMVAV